MGNTLHDYMLRNLELNHPSVFKDAIDFEFTKVFDVVVTLSDGSKVVYDDMQGTIRNLPSADTLSEEQCLCEFGYRLRNIMIHKGISQLELSERTGISQPLLSRYMNGRSSPSFYRVDRIANVLGCSVDDLRVMD